MASPDPLVSRLRAAGCVWAEQEAALIRASVATAEDAEPLAVRRAGGEPLEQVLGWAEFSDGRVRVAPAVFVPRRRTELVAALAVAALGAGAAPVLVDLCTGTGAIAAAVLAVRPDVVVHAADVDPAAVACARHNLPGATVRLGDLDAPLPPDLRGRVDVLTACAPYVPTAALASMPPEAREHEPRRALDGGVDGLDVVHRVVACAPGWLRPGGLVVLEVAEEQVEAALVALRDVGLEPDVVARPERGATAVTGRR